MTDKKRRRRAPPQAAEVTTGSCRFFSPSDVPTLAEIVGQQPLIAEADLADQLNTISADFLQDYAMLNAPSPAGQTATWCRALEACADELLQTLDIPDHGEPQRKLPGATRLKLTGNGVGSVFTMDELWAMGIEEADPNPVHAALDQAAPALWALKRAAHNAAVAYQDSATERSKRRDNAKEPQHLFLLKRIADTLLAGFGYAVPDKHPGAEGTFIKAAMFIKERIISCIKDGAEITEEGTDKAAARRLGLLTGQAAAMVWARRNKGDRADG